LTRLKPKEIREKAEEDFAKAWIETGLLLSEDNMKPRKYPSSKIEAGRSHVVFETTERLRRRLLSLGFSEVLNPVIVDEAEMFKQYGLEAPAILDRCFYLATLERPDVGLGKEKVNELKTLANLDEEKIPVLQSILHSYKKGEVDGDDLIERIAEALGISDVLAMRVLDRVFP
jgi:O-phosphoseryl-tRNA synthetase